MDKGTVGLSFDVTVEEHRHRVPLATIKYVMSYLRLLIKLTLCLAPPLSAIEATVANPVVADLPSQVKDPAKIIQSELEMLDHLIRATQQSLENQKALRVLIQQYRDIQKAYLKTEDEEQLYRLVKAADRVLKTIEANHLTQTFDSTFLSELKLFSQFAAKCGVPKP